MKIKCLVFLIASCVSSFTFAQSITPWGVPQDLQLYSSSSTYVTVVPAGCSGGQYRLSTSLSNYDAVLSVILAAQLADRRIRVRYSGCTSNGQGEIIGVYLE